MHDISVKDDDIIDSPFPWVLTETAGCNRKLFEILKILYFLFFFVLVKQHLLICNYESHDSPLATHRHLRNLF